MKYLAILFSFILVISTTTLSQAQTAPITTSTAVLTWNSNTEPDMKKYTILMGTVPGVYTSNKRILHIQGVSTQTGEFAGLLENQTYVFSVKACDTLGNCSEPSQEVSGKVLIPPGVPSGLGVTIKLNITVTVP